MNKKLTKIFTPVDQISQGKTINSWHILQSIDALTGASPYDIKISGSLEVVGDLYLKLNEPIQDPNEGRLRYLGIDINTNKVEYVSLSSQLDPIEVDPTNRTAWNNGAGNINNNTSFGFMSFISNETGVGNTIIGAYNANELKTGYNNVVLGLNNLNSGNNPYYNIAIGVQSLYKNNSHDNIGLGIQPLYNNINGLNNISFGTKSLFYNISGSNSIAIGGNSLYNNQGSNNIAIGYKSSQNDVNGNNRISIGSFSGKVEGNDYLEIHSYRNELSIEDPLILGNFYERWFKLNGHFILNFSQNPSTNIVNTPYQLLFDEQGNAYQAERSYSVQEINSKFNQNNRETLTQLLPPTISGTNLTIKYVGEDGNIQQHTLDLYGGIPATNEIFIDDATYDASLNIITIHRNDDTQFKINLSEFQVLINTNPDGTVSIDQEGVTKLILSKVSTTGNFNDLLNKPTSLAGYGITDAIDTSLTDQAKIGGITAKKFVTKDGLPSQFVKGDGSLDNNSYLTTETNTTIDDFNIEGNILTIKYTGENQNQQIKSVSLATIQDKYYEHYQPIASNHWVINHNLGKKANITITDELDREIEGEVTLNSTTTAIVDFNKYIIGKAYCN